MTKKKRFINIASIAFLLVLSLFLAACNRGYQGGGGAGGGNNNGGGGGGSVPIRPADPDPSPVDPDTPITDLFSKFKVITTGQNVTILDPTSGTQKEFNSLIDRQAEVLATDILYRLVVVYGNGFTNDFVLNNDYKLNGLQSKINNRDVILTNAGTLDSYNYLNEYNELVGSGLNYLTPIINDSAHYANSLKLGIYNTSHPISTLFNNTHTIAGGYEWSADTEVFKVSEGFGNNTSSFVWNWNYDNANITNSEATNNNNKNNFINKYINHYKPELKSAIIQILSGVAPNQVQEGLTSNQLEQYKNNINYLGFKEQDRDNIQNFVLNQVIGTNNIQTDDNILDDLEYLFGLTNGRLLLPNEGTETYNYFMENEQLHYYKAYNVLIPSMLDRAFYNSFGGKEIDRVLRDNTGEPILDEITGKVQYDETYSLDNLENIIETNNDSFVTLYPRMTRSTDTDLEIKVHDSNSSEAPDFYTLGSKQEIQSIILQPKQGAAVQGLWMSVSGENGIKFDFKINVKYVARGIEHANEYISYNITNNRTSEIFTVDGEYDPTFNPLNLPYHFELDIQTLISTKPYPIFNNYNGITSANTNLWNNPYGLYGYNLAGDNYLEISFEILSATQNGQNYTGPVKFDVGFADPY